jgi:hypothetical protein
MTVALNQQVSEIFDGWYNLDNVQRLYNNTTFQYLAKQAGLKKSWSYFRYNTYEDQIDAIFKVVKYWAKLEPSDIMSIPRSHWRLANKTMADAIGGRWKEKVSLTHYE